MTVDQIRADLSEAGFRLTAGLPAALYNREVPTAWHAEQLLPGARGVLLVGNAGRSLWPHFHASPESSLPDDPLDRYTRRILAETCGSDTAFALYTDQREGTYLPLVALAKRAGIGSPGRIGVLLHPMYGPWISLRGLVFVREPFEPPPTPNFNPCPDCPAPCATACPASVVHPSVVDVEACYQTRLELATCALRCDARAACIIGPEHAFSTAQVAHHSRIRR